MPARRLEAAVSRDVVRPEDEVLHGVQIVDLVVGRQDHPAAFRHDGEPPDGYPAALALVCDDVAHGETAVLSELEVEGVVEVLRRAAGEGAAEFAKVRLDGAVVGDIGLEVLGRLPNAVTAVEIPLGARAEILVEVFAAFVHIAVSVLAEEVEVRGAEPYDARTEIESDQHLGAAALESDAFAVICVCLGVHISSVRCPWVCAGCCASCARNPCWRRAD